MKKILKNKEKIYSLACIVLMIDQFIKVLIRTKMQLNQVVIIIPKFFSIHYLKNTGAAFSILRDNTIILIIISVAMIYLINRFIEKEKKLSERQKIYIGILLGGIFGNLIDRIAYRGVIDYLSFTFFGYNFPVFNLADIGITVGVFLLIINYLRNKKNIDN